VARLDRAEPAGRLRLLPAAGRAREVVPGGPEVEALLQAARLLDADQRKLEWRDVRAIRESEEPATRLAGRCGVSETLIRRIRRNEIWVTRRPREATRPPARATLLLAGRGCPLCQLDESQVELAARRIRIPRLKTDAS
jgi:hypothetical protein